MKCSKCGKEITSNIKWHSMFEVYDDNDYCSEECVKIDNQIIIDKIHKDNMLKRWKDLRGALYLAFDIIDESECEEKIEHDYPTIHETIEMFNKWILKDYS